ncbi:MAG: DUF4007 family protein [Thiolinea sp.]
MRLTKQKTSFGRHETFPLRYGWLSKGVEITARHPRIFSEQQHEQAMIALGLGRNMLNALHYWLQATHLVVFQEGVGEVTPLGKTLLGAEGDPYLEDEATLWIMHWLIASNAELATGFFWFFNHYAVPRFREQDAFQTFCDFVEKELGLKRSVSTLKSDFSTLLRMYAPAASRGGEEHLDSPLASLGLIELNEVEGYNSLRSTRPFLPPIALHFALQQRFDAQKAEYAHEPAIPTRELLYGGSGWAAPGAIFRLNEEGLMANLQRMIEHYPHHYELRETAGLNQLYCLTSKHHTELLLSDYYLGRVA